LSDRQLRESDRVNIRFNDDSGDHDFRIESNGNTHMFFVDASADKVGIGTSSSLEAELQVNGTILLEKALWLRNGLSELPIPLHRASAFIYRSNPSSPGDYPFDDDGHLVLQASAVAGSYKDIVLMKSGSSSNDPSAALVVNSFGGVGIGTTNPSDFVHVYRPTHVPYIKVEHGMSDGLAGIKLKSGTEEWSIENNAGSNRLQFYYGATQNMVVQSDGKVGIGTTTPRGRLVVSDGSIYLDNCQYLYGRNARNTADVGMLTVDGVNNTQVTASEALNFSTGGSTHAFLTAAGDFGIGTTSPGARLHVNGRTISGNATPSATGTQFAVRTSGLWTWSALASLQTNGAGANDEYFLAMRSNEDATPDNEFLFRTNGDAVADGSWTGGGADYAEWFEREEKIPEGSLVGLNLETGKARIWRKDDPLMGVQSMNPGFISNNTIGAEDTPKEMKEDHVLVALIGQVEIRSDDITEKGKRVSTSDGQFIGWRLANGKVFVK
jgi:hypothetical protein